MSPLDMINEILFWALLYVLIWQAYILLFNKGTPNIKTAPAIRDWVIQTLRAEMVEHDSFTIIDMGSGNGAFSRSLASALPKANIIGLEISKLALWQANLMRHLKKIDNVTYENADFFKTDLTRADAIYIYQVPAVMVHLRDTFKNLKPGTLILSNKFPLGGRWEPEEVVDVKTLMPHQKTVYLYRAP